MGFWWQPNNDFKFHSVLNVWFQLNELFPNQTQNWVQRTDVFFSYKVQVIGLLTIIYKLLMHDYSRSNELDIKDQKIAWQTQSRQCTVPVLMKFWNADHDSLYENSDAAQVTNILLQNWSFFLVWHFGSNMLHLFNVTKFCINHASTKVKLDDLHQLIPANISQRTKYVFF